MIDHVKFNNIESVEKRIEASFSAISKLGSICGVAITGTYRNLKKKELHLAYEYQVEKQKEKERLKQLRAEERERVQLEKEIEEARRKIEKEQTHYSNALVKLNQQIAAASPEELAVLEEKKVELEAHLTDLQQAREKVDYRAANQKAGYVYIISNWVYFWPNENDPLEPVHVHVAQGTPTANATKIWITAAGGCYLCNNNSHIHPRVLRIIMLIIEARSDEVIQKWLAHFGSATYFC